MCTATCTGMVEPCPKSEQGSTGPSRSSAKRTGRSKVSGGDAGRFLIQVLYQFPGIVSDLEKRLRQSLQPKWLPFFVWR